jgi:hypothetical protein
MALRDVHNWHGWVAIGANAVVGVWALAAHLLPVLRHRVLWWSTAAAQIDMIAQVILGVYLVSGEGYVAESFHQFYGYVALVTVGLIYSYRQQVQPYLYLLYGFGGLFIMGLGLRAVTKHS